MDEKDEMDAVILAYHMEYAIEALHFVASNCNEGARPTELREVLFAIINQMRRIVRNEEFSTKRFISDEKPLKD